MLEITTITNEFAVAPQISAADFGTIRDAGFQSVLNVRPDDEIGTYMHSEHAARNAKTCALGYAHTPAENHALFEPKLIDQFENALIELPKPVLAHCKTGTRAVILWALVAARHRTVRDVMATLAAAGQDLAFLEQELIDQSSDARKSPLRLRNDGLLNLGRSPLLGS